MATARAMLRRPATPMARASRGPRGIQPNRVASMRLPPKATTINPIGVTRPPIRAITIRPTRAIPAVRSTGRLAVEVGIQVVAVARPTLGHLVVVVAVTPVAAVEAVAPRVAAEGAALQPRVEVAATPAAAVVVVVHAAAAEADTPAVVVVAAVLHPAVEQLAVPTAAETHAKAPASVVC